jgi:hypothetical protein
VGTQEKDWFVSQYTQLAKDGIYAFPIRRYIRFFSANKKTSPPPRCGMTPEASNLASLVEERTKSLKIDESELMTRLGYRGRVKFRLHLGELLTGTNLRPTLLSRLHSALEVSQEVVALAVAGTMRLLKEKDRERYLREFQPHAVLLCERTRPSPVFAAAVIGVDKLLVLKFDLAAGPQTFVDQVLDQIAEKCGESLRNDGAPFGVPAFGKVLGFTINYSADHAVQYDLEGRQTATLNYAVRIGTARLAL